MNSRHSPRPMPKAVFVSLSVAKQKKKADMAFKCAFYASSLVINIMTKESKSRAEDIRIARSCKYLIH